MTLMAAEKLMGTLAAQRPSTGAVAVTATPLTPKGMCVGVGGVAAEGMRSQAAKARSARPVRLIKPVRARRPTRVAAS
jgi:hypothetical protein